MNSAKVDLNLLIVFSALYEHRQVTRAAHVLGVTQPAVSNALRRLRAVVQDPLFVRVGNVMRPTARAQAMIPAIRAALGQLASALGEATFSPASTTLNVRLAMPDDIELTFLPAILQSLMTHAPGASVQSRRVSGIFELPLEALEQGTVDFAIGAFGLPARPSTGVQGRPLYRDSFVCITGADRGSQIRTLTKRGLLEMKHVAVLYPGVGPGLMDRVLAAQGLSRKVVVAVPHFTTAATLVARSDLCATVPRRFAKMVGRWLPIVHHELPIDLPTIEIGVYWHVRSDSDPALRWACRLLLEVGAAQTLVERTRAQGRRRPT
jgi:DNA-binding transcriptional LysR family regulator